MNQRSKRVREAEERDAFFTLVANLAAFANRSGEGAVALMLTAIVRAYR